MTATNPNTTFWHRSNEPIHIGCARCPELRICGGLRTRDPAVDCTWLCHGAEGDNPRFICRCNPSNFVARVREVGGFDLNTVGSAPKLLHPHLPLVIPFLYNGNRRREVLDTEAVAVPMAKLFSHKSGNGLFSCKDELAKKFKFAAASRLVVVGVDRDQPLEDYWSKARAAGFHRRLADLRPEVVTTPNYSLFCDVPRWDNLHNMKRIAICWQEIASAGICAAIHVNARTDHDWARWTEFLVKHPEVEAVAFEFKTGPASPLRAEWYAGKLCELARNLNGHLDLITRGGQRHLSHFMSAFRHVTFIATEPFVKAQKRRYLTWRPGIAHRWIPTITLERQPLDGLLQHNVDVFSRMVTYRGHVN